jgi:phosphoribosylamine--glycine ligase
VLQQVDRDVLVPIVSAMENEGAPYRGLLYAGLMLTHGGPKVLEFNCRFGDPETQAILIRLQSDLFELLDATVRGKLDQVDVRWDPRPAVCVVMASAGYPGSYPRGKLIEGVEAASALPDVKVYQAGTRMTDGRLWTSGGRVLGVTALGDSFAAAARRAYEAAQLIRFEGAHYRKDIAARV